MHREKLLTLQHTESQLDALESEYQQYPKQLTDVKSLCQTHREESNRISVEREALRKERSVIADKLALEETRLKKSKSRLSEIKSNFEYHALKREIDGTDKSNKELEQALKKINSELEVLDKAYEQEMEALSQVEAELNKIEDMVSQQTAEFEKIKAAKQSEIEDCQKSVDAGTLAMFRKIRVRYQNAIVSAENGVCHGCHMNLPKQFEIEMQRNKKDIFQCPSCMRLLHIDHE